ncbi:hypothetical protein DFH09DRAFT_1355333 [Mycena vulgaris]|nr:hypothetical protein DFH09DRAFT_1355333 [Mycena vulgaris]
MSFRKDRVRAVSSCKIPEMSVQIFEEHIGPTVDAFLKIPIVEKNLLKFDVSIANGDFDQTLKSLSMQKSSMNVMFMVEAENWEKLNEIVREPAFRGIFEAATKSGATGGFDLTTSHVFCADFVTKVNK